MATGMEEAERQHRVGERLYKASGGKIAWKDLNPGLQRKWIDMACSPEYRDSEN